MSEMLEDLGDYLVTQGITETIKKGSVPESPDVCVVLLKSKGAQTLRSFHGVFGDIERLQIQARGNADDYLAAYTLCTRVRNILDDLNAGSINGHFYSGCISDAAAAPLYQDTNRRWIHYCDFSVIKGRETP